MIVKTFEEMVKTELNAPFEKRKVLAEKMYAVLLEFYEVERYDICISLLLLIKSLKCPLRNLNVIRAKLQTFGKLGGEDECYREELRFFPDNEEARILLEKYKAELSKKIPNNTNPDFENIYKYIENYTMVEVSRLFPLYLKAQEICAKGIKGNFVECGVAGGGTSAMLAYVLKQNMASCAKRKLFCCDSFEGMPEPTEYDMSYNGVHASQTIWGAGTCAAPESSVQEICEKLHAEDVIIIVKGYFEHTIIEHKGAMGKIALLHMDGDWYSSTKVVIENLYDQLESGAYVQIDDYYSWKGCKKAVDEFIESRKLNLKLEPVDGIAVCFYKP